MKHSIETESFKPGDNVFRLNRTQSNFTGKIISVIDKYYVSVKYNDSNLPKQESKCRLSLLNTCNVVTQQCYE